MLLYGQITNNNIGTEFEMDSRKEVTKPDQIPPAK